MPRLLLEMSLPSVLLVLNLTVSLTGGRLSGVLRSSLLVLVEVEVGGGETGDDVRLGTTTTFFSGEEEEVTPSSLVELRFRKLLSCDVRLLALSLLSGSRDPSPRRVFLCSCFEDELLLLPPPPPVPLCFDLIGAELVPIAFALRGRYFVAVKNFV